MSTEPTEPRVFKKTFTFHTRIPSWLAPPKWMLRRVLKRMGATVEQEQTLEGVHENWKLKKEYRIGE